ncbi:MAG: oligosaccharide flippase family protein, partial [Clostridia bacterium]|nr:oligosaccharide flippase family protein [Clostridia bacterium]
SGSIMRYFQLVVDFGFLLSATEEVSRKRDDKKALDTIFTSVTLIKLLLTAACFSVMLSLSFIVPQWRALRLFFVIDFFSVTLGSLIPDYLYRGVEKMTAVTVRTVVLRLLSAALIFVFVKKPGDEILIPIFLAAGNLAALFFVYFDVKKRLGVGFCRVGRAEIFSRLKVSGLFFFSRVATTLYTVTNTVVLDIVYKGNGVVTSANSVAVKITDLAKNGISPVSDSLYPYMVKNRDFRMVKKLLLIFEPIIIAACVVFGIFIEPIFALLGKDFTFVAAPLRAMLPAVAVILPSYIFGFPVMGAMGINKYANYSTIFGSAVHIAVMAVLLITGRCTPVTAGLATSFTEISILVFRMIVVYKNRHLLKAPPEEKKPEISEEKNS